MTKQDEVLATVRLIFQEVSEEALPEISLQTSITDLGIDSISLAEAVGRIEEALNIEFPLLEWLRVRTIHDLLDVIEQAEQKQGG